MIFCRACGREIHESAPACPHCGASVTPVAGSGGTLWLSVPSLVMGIVSVLTLFDESQWNADNYVGAGMFASAAIGLGAAGIFKQTRGRGMAIAGVVLGGVALLGLLGRFAS